MQAQVITIEKKNPLPGFPFKLEQLRPNAPPEVIAWIGTNMNMLREFESSEAKIYKSTN